MPAGVKRRSCRSTQVNETHYDVTLYVGCYALCPDTCLGKRLMNCISYMFAHILIIVMLSTIFHLKSVALLTAIH